MYYRGLKPQPSTQPIYPSPDRRNISMRRSATDFHSHGVTNLQLSAHFPTISMVHYSEFSSPEFVFTCPIKSAAVSWFLNDGGKMPTSPTETS